MDTIPSLKVLAPMLVLIFSLNSCSMDDDGISYDLTGSWKVLYYMDGSRKITKTKDNTWPDINNGDITANFTELGGSGKGRISGIKVSNGYDGEYTIPSAGEISIGPITTTFINEPEWTQPFHISSAENYEIRNSLLFIYYGNNRKTIAFERN